MVGGERIHEFSAERGLLFSELFTGNILIVVGIFFRPHAMTFQALNIAQVYGLPVCWFNT